MSDDWAQKQVEKFIFDFDHADKDKNGTLSAEEVVEVLRACGFKGEQEEGLAIFAHLDKNKDDKISRDEFQAVCLKLPKMSIKEFVLRRLFNSLDADKSGYLDRKEVMDAFSADVGFEVSADLVSDILIYLCGDEDKKVAYDEFLRVLEFEESASVLNQIFRRLDKDMSGSLTLDEINAGIALEGELAKLRPAITELLKAQAADADGKLNYHEFVQAWLAKKGEEVKK